MAHSNTINALIDSNAVAEQAAGTLAVQGTKVVNNRSSWSDATIGIDAEEAGTHGKHMDKPLSTVLHRGPDHKHLERGRTRLSACQTDAQLLPTTRP